MWRVFAVLPCFLLTAATSPSDRLIDKGELGILFYGFLFIVAALIGLVGLLVRSISSRDKLIAEIVKQGTEAAKDQAKANESMAVQLALIVQKTGARNIGEPPQ